MARGGRKRTDKKPGRDCNSWHSSRNFMKMSSAQVPNASGQWVSASSAKVDQNRDFFETVLPSQCGDRTARNKRARTNRGTVTGRRPHGMTLDEWARTIAGGGRRGPRGPAVEVEAE